MFVLNVIAVLIFMELSNRLIKDYCVTPSMTIRIYPEA